MRPENSKVYMSCLTAPYYLHRTNAIIYRASMLAALFVVAAAVIYSVKTVEFSAKNLGIWILGFVCLVVLSNIKKFWYTLFNPKAFISFIWNPIIQFAADRDGFYFNFAYRKGRWPKKDEIVFIEWPRIESIGFETRRRDRQLVVKVKLTVEEGDLLGGKTVKPFSYDELVFANETPNEKEVLDTLRSIRAIKYGYMFND